MAVVEHTEHSADITDSLEDASNPANNQLVPDAQPDGQDREPIIDGSPSAKPIVPDDHPTKLGRRVSKMEEHMTDMLDRFDVLIGKLDQGVPTRVQDPYGYEPRLAQDDVPEHVKETVDAVKKELAKEASREQEMQHKYATDYIKAVQRGFGETDEELHNAVVKELTEINFRNYNKHTGNPLADAQINYDRAVATILRRQRTPSRGTPNVHGDRPNAPTDVSSASRLDGPPEKKIELDEYSRKFLKAIGAKEDDPWVIESLKGSK